MSIAAVGGAVSAVGDLIDIGEKLFGNGDEEAEKRYQEQLALQKKIADRNEHLQREFAQNGIRWKMADAKAAGLHPVAALGATGTSFSPISVGSVDHASSKGHLSGIGESLSRMGQNVSRAARATETEVSRLELDGLNLRNEGLRLDNALKGQNLVKAGQPPTPPMPEEKSHISDMTYSRTKAGGIAPVPSEGFADRAEDQWAPQIAWAMRNLLNPVDPAMKARTGHQWVWNPYRFEFEEKPLGPVGRGSRWDVEAYNKARKWLGTSEQRRQQNEKTPRSGWGSYWSR